MTSRDIRLTSLAHGGGCGCKLAPSVLQQLLAGQPTDNPYKQLLVGTETGVGVRNAGTIGASAGEVVVTIDGRLTNSGSMLSTADTRIDAAARTVALSDGSSLPYDRLILAPGVEFTDAYGLTQAD